MGVGVAGEVPARPEAGDTPKSVSPFAGRGLFTTSETGFAIGLHPDWTAIQKDPEGDHRENVPGHLMFWQARPTREVVDEANSRHISYIAQAENPAELAECLRLGPTITVPKALIGNPRAWGADGQKAALEQGWDCISEWYWNAHPWELSPDGGNYPRFVNVCFGVYSEGDPGGDGYVPQSKSLADYRAVWRGSFSVWKAEAMTDADRANFNEEAI